MRSGELALAVIALGWLITMAAFAVTQDRFYESHWRAHGEWRSKAERFAEYLSLRWDPAEMRALWRAASTRDPDPRVENARRKYLFVLGLAVAYLLAVIPLFVVLVAIGF